MSERLENILLSNGDVVSFSDIWNSAPDAGQRSVRRGAVKC